MLRARWLGRVRYRDAYALQQALSTRTTDNYLLLLEHPHVFTLGLRGTLADVLVAPATVGAELVRTNRGGQVTYHGPGQLVGYPIVSAPTAPEATPRYVASVEQLIIDVCSDLGLPNAGRMPGAPGVWLDPGDTGRTPGRGIPPKGPLGPRKLCAVGVRRTRGRTMHGFALNVDPDLGFFDHIVPCGMHDRAVTSLAREGIGASMRDVVDAVVARAAALWGDGAVEWAAVAPPLVASDGSAGETAEPVAVTARKPPWLRVPVRTGPQYVEIKRTMRSLDLVTVCEEAGCPNIFECWNDGTATFMINGDRCTRACGFCLVDTRRPLDADPAEPERVAEAVERMGLAHAVITAVARDDMADGGAGAFAECIAAVHRRCPGTTVEVLVPDFKGDPDALSTVFVAGPDVFNHNLETVARLQRAARPQASYGRSLAVLARAAAAGLMTKSGIILGMGETQEEVVTAMGDLRNVGVSILTLGQYLRPTAGHLPVARWWHPDEFDRLRLIGEAMGFAHVESSPLTRSSYHARQATEAAAPHSLPA